MTKELKEEIKGLVAEHKEAEAIVTLVYEYIGGEAAHNVLAELAGGCESFSVTVVCMMQDMLEAYITEKHGLAEWLEIYECL